MNKPKYVFSQLVAFMDSVKFRHIVDKYDGNRYVKHFTCWNQLLTLMFGQLSNRECLVAIVQHDMRLKRSTYEVLQILSMSLTDTTHLRDLFDKTIFKNDIDRSGSSEPNLFNF